MNVYGATTEEVLFHHLQAIQSGDLDAVVSDYADNSLMFTIDAVLKGRDEIRQFFALVSNSSPSSDTRFDVLNMVIEGEFAYMVSSMDSTYFSIPFGIDTFVIRDSKIVAHTYIAHIVPKFGPEMSTKIRFELPESPEKDTFMRRLQAMGDNDIDALMSCYAEDAIIIMPDTILRGRDMIKAYYSAELGGRTSKGLPFDILQAVVNKEFACLVWSSESENISIPMGADSFVFRDGKIVTQAMAMQIAPGIEHAFSMSLNPGLNMISLPLKSAVPYTARSFAEKLSANVIIRYDEMLRKFVGFDVKAPGDGFSIEGGKGYIVNVLAGGKFTFTGSAWTNAAPHNIDNSNSWAFIVSGSVLNDKEMAMPNKDYTVIVKNLKTGSSVTEMTDSNGYFTVAYADLSHKSVVSAGDDLEIRVLDNGKLVSGPYAYKARPDDVRNAVMRVQLHLGYTIPAKSELLQNYPNPFNPETWIPYCLKDAGFVSIRIYDITGQLIRTLNLGHKSTGIYTSMVESAYWDGKNESGEVAGSGVYFYRYKFGRFFSHKKDDFI